MQPCSHIVSKLGLSLLQILDIPTPDVATPYQLEYDVEWLAILSLTEPLMKYTKTHWSTPSPLTHQRLELISTKRNQLYQMMKGSLPWELHLVRSLSLWLSRKRNNSGKIGFLQAKLSRKRTFHHFMKNYVVIKAGIAKIVLPGP